jgi:hypothetical protein
VTTALERRFRLRFPRTSIVLQVGIASAKGSFGLFVYERAQRAAIAMCSVLKGMLDVSKVECMPSMCCVEEPHRNEQ